MLRRAHTGAHLALILIVVLFSTSIVFAQDAKPEPVGLRPDAPAYALHGPYWVGTRQFDIDAGTEKHLLLNAWYPALNPEGKTEEITYTVIFKDATLPADAKINPIIYGHALRDAKANVSDKPYPLIVFSPGFGAVSQEYAPLIEHFTSYGFVVLAPEHREMFDWEFSGLFASVIDRPNDIKRVLDYAETLTAAKGDMAGLIDMETVAVVGHSSGGYTALAAAGARFDLKAWAARCEATAKDSVYYLYNCATIIPHIADMAARANLPAIPDGLWPSMGDSRVDAIISMAGDSYLFDKAGLAEIKIPILAMGGTSDNGTDYEWGAHPAYQYASSPQKSLVTFENGDHMIFGAGCADEPYVDGVLFTWWFCQDSVWDKARGLDLANHFGTAFLLDVLKGDKDAHTALAPAAVSFPGIQYEAQGY